MGFARVCAVDAGASYEQAATREPAEAPGLRVLPRLLEPVAPRGLPTVNTAPVRPDDQTGTGRRLPAPQPAGTTHTTVGGTTAVRVWGSGMAGPLLRRQRVCWADSLSAFSRYLWAVHGRRVKSGRVVRAPLRRSSGLR